MELINQAPATEKQHPFNDCIELRDVVVNYEQFKLGPINLKFEKGKKYALIGHSGSGKSTILNLLMQYESYEEGEILIDGISLKELESASMMMCLNQAEHLFLGSFLENISVYDSYDTSELKSVILNTNCERLNQLSTKESCKNLSGGEKQLVNFVKSIMSKHSILLLDESFSALDKITKSKMYAFMYQQSDKLLVAVTHDLTPQHLEKFDEVIIFNDGVIQKQGKFEEVEQSSILSESA